MNSNVLSATLVTRARWRRSSWLLIAAIRPLAGTIRYVLVLIAIFAAVSGPSRAMAQSDAATTGAVVGAQRDEQPDRRSYFLNRPPPQVISDRGAGNTHTDGRVSKLPFFFEPNRGQADSEIDFVARSPTYRAFMSPCKATVAIPGRRAATTVRERERKRTLGGAKRETPVLPEARSFQVRTVSTRPGVEIIGEQLLAGRSHYFKGDDEDKWVRDVPNYGALRCAKVYDGIDILFLGERRGLKFDIIVQPEGDPSEIELSFSGIAALSVGEDGSLTLDLGDETIPVTIPGAYQMKDGKRRTIEAAFVQSGPDRVRLSVGEYDPSLVLVIDPLILIYENLLVAGGDETITGVAAVLDGDVVVTGNFLSGDEHDVVAARFDSDGELVWNTTIGGSGFDSAVAVTLDSLDNVYVGGSTDSNNFPVVNGFLPDQGNFDGFIVKLNPAGDAISYSTYLGGGEEDFLEDLSVDSEDRVVVTGSTESVDFPGVSSVHQGFTDGFLSKLTKSGDALVFSRLFGGSQFDEPRTLYLQGDDKILVAGHTTSPEFPLPEVQAGGIQDEYAGGVGTDGFVVRFTADAANVLYATYLGGTNGELIKALVLASDGSLIIGGTTSSEDFPLVNDIQESTPATGPGAFLARIDVTGSDLTLATRLGGTFTSIEALSLDDDDTLYVVGTTDSVFPIDWPNYKRLNGEQTAFLAVVGHRGELIRDLVFLGSGWGHGQDVAFDRASRSVYAVGDFAEILEVDEQEGGTLILTGPRIGFLRKYEIPFSRFEYAAKMVVGRQGFFGLNKMLVEGVYGTSVNIRNAGSRPVQFSKELARTWVPAGGANPIPQTPGPVTRISTHLLAPGEALLTDGNDLMQKLQWPGPLMEGFLVIRSDGPLDVTAVYTSGRTEDGETLQTAIDVSQVQERDRQQDHDISVFTSASTIAQGPLASSPIDMAFTTRITNRGSFTVEDMDIEDLFLSFDISARNDYSVSHGGTWQMDVVDNNTILFEVHIPALPPGQTATITRSVVFPANPAGDGLLTNVVTANPSVLDPNAANNSYTFIHDKN